ncbi:MAG TPA: twin-arginine translocase TatA/TatE family subunit [Steroidobacteraceae bacterium]|jgi:sec-independent protein translocase protein TatA|nr:twin-arginine translocase TatA/TatE family subunit [Steroidobacteraceae bacterium]
MGIGFRELLVILLIALLIFGGKKLRTIGSDLGAAVRDFKKSMDAGEKEADEQKPLKQLTGNDADFAASEKQGTKPEQKSNV